MERQNIDGEISNVIYNSDMPREVKEAWIALLEDMSIEEKEKLLQVFEKEDVNNNMKNNFSKVIEELHEEHDKNDEHRKNILKKISDLL